MFADRNKDLRGRDSSHLYRLFQVPREVERQLHGEPSFGRGAKRLRQAVGHLNRNGCLFVDQVGKSLTSDTGPVCGESKSLSSPPSGMASRWSMKFSGTSDRPRGESSRRWPSLFKLFPGQRLPGIEHLPFLLFRSDLVTLVTIRRARAHLKRHILQESMKIVFCFNDFN